MTKRKKKEKCGTLEFLLSLMGGLLALAGFFVAQSLMGSPYAWKYVAYLDPYMVLFVLLIEPIASIIIIIGSILMKIKGHVGSKMVLVGSFVLLLSVFYIPTTAAIICIFALILSISGSVLNLKGK